VAVKIVRQSNKVTLLGAPVSAAASASGYEKTPAALRAAGLIARLREVGLEVIDSGDDPIRAFESDDSNPRARNLSAVAASIESLRPRVELAIKSGAFPVILGGDRSISLAALAAMRRYYRSLSFIAIDSEAALHTPATTSTGILDGMLLSHVVGRGAAEIVRLWSEPPLVRETDVALFGATRFDAAEEEFLSRSPLRSFSASSIARSGVASAASAALEVAHASRNEFLLHLSPDVISKSEFPPADSPASDSSGQNALSLQDLREALALFAASKHFAAFEISGYDPFRDPNGAAAELLVGIIVAALKARLDALTAPPHAAAEPPPVLRDAAPDLHHAEAPPTQDAEGGAAAAPAAGSQPGPPVPPSNENAESAGPSPSAAEAPDSSLASSENNSEIARITLDSPGN
jgi:arginase